MIFKHLIILILFFGALFCNPALADNGDDAFMVTWNIDNIDRIADHETMKLSEPSVVSTGDGPAVLFDGIDDGLLVKSNPLEGARTAFTVEVVFRPDASYPNNKEQRFIHIQNPDNPNRRILIELRLTSDQRWYLDTFIKSDTSAKTLVLPTALHPVGQWYHAALVYDNGTMKHYVNGVEEMSGKVDFLPISAAQTSIGTRMNRRSWYKGAIRTLRVTHKALSPDAFLIRSISK